jgi:hypothetical protein
LPEVVGKALCGLYKVLMRGLRDFYFGYRLYKLFYAGPKRKVGRSTRVKYPRCFDGDSDDEQSRDYEYSFE